MVDDSRSSPSSAAAPAAGRPRARGPWSEAEAWRFLGETAVPLRLACQDGAGFPLLLSLWFVPEGGALWCASIARARVVRLLAREPRCAFEVSPDAPPYRGVRGRARATLVPERGEAVLRALLQRYQGGESSQLARWLLSRAHEEVAIRLAPETLVSWDYTRRMQAP